VRDHLNKLQWLRRYGYRHCARVGPATIKLTTPSPSGPLNLGAGSAPSTVIDSNGVIDVAWIAPVGIEFAQSHDNGATFSAPMLALSLGGLSEQMNLQLDAANDLVIFATFNTNAVTPAAFLARSTDGGKSFSSIPINHNGFFPVVLLMVERQFRTTRFCGRPCRMR
jgi:hypothetical protein